MFINDRSRKKTKNNKRSYSKIPNPTVYEATESESRQGYLPTLNIAF